MTHRTPRNLVLLLSAAISVSCCVCAVKCARADDVLDETPKTPVLEWAYQGAALADMLTTLDIKNHPGIHETNPLMGPHPSDDRVLGYFAAYDLLHYGITRILVDLNAPRSLVTVWELGTIGYETDLVVHNYRLGLRFAF
jgi:hypothetical protein